MGRRNFLAIFLIIVVASFVRFYRISHHSLWDDEIMTADTVKLPISRLLFVLATQDATPPLFYLIAHNWVKVGYSEAWLRLLCASFSVATVVVIFLFAKTLFGPRVAIFSGFVSSFWPLGVYTAQEFRAYALLILFVSLTLYAFVALLFGKKWAVWGFPISAALGFLTHYYFSFVLAVLAFYFILWWVRAWRIVRTRASEILRLIYYISKSFGATGKSVAIRGLRELIVRINPWLKASVSSFLALVLVSIAFLFWFKFFIVQLAVAQSWRPYIEPLKMLADIALGLTVSSLPVLDSMRSFWTSWYFIVALLGWALLIFAGFSAKTARLFTIGLPLSFVAILLIVCQQIHLFDLRATACIFPTFMVWAGAGFDNLWMRKKLRPVALIASTAIFAGSLVSLYHYYFDPRFERQNWKDAADYVRAQMTDDTLIVSYIRSKALGLEYYLGKNLNYLIEDADALSKITDRDGFFSERAESFAKSCRIVLLDYHGQFFDPHDVLRKRLKKDHTLVEVKSWTSYDSRTDFSIWIYDRSKKVEDISLSERIDFSRLDSAPQIIDGFSPPIMGMRFMGNRGKVALSTSDLKKKCFELAFYVHFDFFDGKPFKVWVEQDGAEKGYVVVDKEGTYQITAPIEVFPNQTVLIDIVSEKTFVPSEVLQTDEKTPLSIGAISAAIVKCP